MKKVFFIFVVFATLRAYAYDFPTQCQSGYKDVNHCLMYIPSNTTYSDETGWFEYTSLCPLE